MTDDIQQTARSLDLVGDWSVREVGTLAAEERDLWRELGSGGPPWCLDLPASTAAGFWRWVVVVADASCSQFDALRDLMSSRAHLAGPVAALALQGSRFHGHRGRPWLAAPGNLHLVVAARPQRPAAQLGLAMTMLPVVAVVDAVAAASNGQSHPGIKWVNDVLLDGHKVAGVLTATQAQGSRLELVTLGIGLNVATRPVVASTPFVPEVGCLRDFRATAGLTLSRCFWTVLDALALRFSQLLTAGPLPLWRAYCDNSLITGRAVRIWPEGGTEGTDPAGWPPPLAAGVVRRIGRDLALHLEGRSEPVSKGRLAFEVVCRSFGL